MSQEEPEIPSATPLDLLINAIAGSTDYVYPPTYTDALREPEDIPSIPPDDHVQQTSNLDGYLNNEKATASHIPQKRRDRAGSLTPRQKEIVNKITEHVVESHTRRSAILNHDHKATTIEVWHPTTGQKSYGKERRILAPPPKLCISGPLLPSITSVTLSTTSISSSPDSTPNVSSSQTHMIASSSFPGTSIEPTAEETMNIDGKKPEKVDRKRKFKDLARNAGFGATLPKSRTNIEGKARESLMEDGLNFPGLWIGEDAGKSKEFDLELTIKIEDEEPSKKQIDKFAENPIVDQQVDHVVTGDARPQEEEQNIHQPFQGIDETNSFSDVLDPSSMEVLQPLAEAVQQANKAAESTLAEHLPEIPDTSSIPQANMIDTSELVNETSTPIAVDTQINDHSEPSDIITLSSIPYMTFYSTPLKIVSKPSQKTAKARSITSCFSVNSSFALWTRINAQTVRTKYMKLEHDSATSTGDGFKEADGVNAKLTSKTGKWTPFKFEIIQRATPTIVEAGKTIRPNNKSPEQIEARSQIQGNIPKPSKAVEENEDILTYGSTVRLVDLQSGVRSDIVKIVKIDDCEHKFGEHDGHPVSELQRIGLVKLNGDLTEYSDGDEARWYLSAPGARLGGGELISGGSGNKGGRAKPTPKAKVPTSSTIQAITADGALPPPETLSSMEDSLQPSALEQEQENTDEPPKKKKRTKRNALASAVLAEDEDGGSQTVLLWFKAETEERNGPVDGEKGGQEKTMIIDKVDEWMSWIIGGVACSSQTFFSTATSVIQDDKGSKSINPIPMILIPPTFDSEQNTLDLTLSQFHFPPSASSSSNTDEPLEVYLGPIGPLHTTTWKSTSYKNTPTLAIPLDSPQSQYDISPQRSESQNRKVISSYPANKKHVIIQNQMPHAEEILEVMQECSARVKETIRTSSSNANTGMDGGSIVEDVQMESIPGNPIPSSDNVSGTPKLDTSKITNVNTTESIETSWFNDEVDNQIAEQGPSKHDELSIEAALRMTSGDGAAAAVGGFEALDDLESFNQQEQNSRALPITSDPDIIRPTLGNQSQPAEHDSGVGSSTVKIKQNELILDPSLRDYSNGITNGNDDLYNQPSSALRSPQTNQQDTIKLHKSQQTSNDDTLKSELTPLPIILIRQSDGMAFEIGKQVIAERIDGSTTDSGQQVSRGVAELNNVNDVKWGLKVVDTSD